jgi:hypothetical protein
LSEVAVAAFVEGLRHFGILNTVIDDSNDTAAVQQPLLAAVRDLHYFPLGHSGSRTTLPGIFC